MADNRQFSLSSVIRITVLGVDAEVSILADTPEELLHVVATLTGQSQQAQPAPQPQQEQAPAPTQAATPAASQPAPQPQQTAQPGPSAAATAQPGPATPSATPTAAQPSQPQLTVNDVLGPARQLLQQTGGEDTLRQILANHGAEAISTADPAQFGSIKAAIEQSLGGQA